MTNNLFITGLVGETLVRVVLDPRGEPVSQEWLLQGEFGRLRAITEGPDGYLYFATSNHDGRGEPTADRQAIPDAGWPVNLPRCHKAYIRFD